MLDDFTQCMVTNSRMAARAITRRYDRHLRSYGVTSTQLSLLAAIRDMGGRTVSELAESRGFDRTTLTRNLDRLEAMGLIESHAAERGNGRLCTMTPSGSSLMQELLPAWREAQDEMRGLLGEGFEATLDVLKRLARV
ncbi:MAG TPA: MarR family winged helix-turn-helix transcriptional regulator [Devosia sp.]|nr:MarR family winged helix-turn-helix transcriptional regulator [Devosia sp.]